MNQDQPVPDAIGASVSTAGSVIDGRGRQAIRMWSLRRAEAGLPDAGSWDGPLVALAIALMWDKGVEAETQRFRQARAELLDEFQIALDLRIGHDCVAEFTDRGESQRGSWSSARPASAQQSTWDLFLTLVGQRTDGTRPPESRPRLPFQRAAFTS